MPGRVGAAATKSGRFGTTGRAVPGEQDGKVYARNRCREASSSSTSSNPVDLGWCAVRIHPCGRQPGDRGGGELSERLYVSGLAGRGEGLWRSHDETAGAKPGASPVDRSAVNVGTIRSPFPASCGDRSVAGRRVRVGRSRRSTPRPGEPVTWGRAAARGSKEGL